MQLSVMLNNPSQWKEIRTFKTNIYIQPKGLSWFVGFFFKQCYFSVYCITCIFLPLSGLLLLWRNSKGENCISFLRCSFCKNYLMLAASGIKPAGLEGCKGISEFYGNVQSSTGNLCNAAVISTREQKNFWELDVFLPGVLVGDGCVETHL